MKLKIVTLQKKFMFREHGDFRLGFLLTTQMLRSLHTAGKCLMLEDLILAKQPQFSSVWRHTALRRNYGCGEKLTKQQDSRSFNKNCINDILAASRHKAAIIFSEKTWNTITGYL
jgi:hypothetical protein